MRHPALYTLNGETLSLRAWAIRLGMHPVRGQCTLYKRIVILGWPVERALTAPARRWIPERVAFAAGRGRSSP